MLLLGQITRRVHWQAANITLQLRPLPESENSAFVKATTQIQLGDDGTPEDIQRDTLAYAQMVGRYCIQGWEGVGNTEGEAIKCTPEAIDEFMQIGPAQTFLFNQVKGLSLWLQEEEQAAGNACGRATDGTPKAETAPCKA